MITLINKMHKLYVICWAISKLSEGGGDRGERGGGAHDYALHVTEVNAENLNYFMIYLFGSYDAQVICNMLGY